MTFFIENAGGNSAQAAGPSFTTVAHGEQAYHQFRRFVIVKEVSEQFFCYCWLDITFNTISKPSCWQIASPITTYGGRGVAKPGVDQSAHTIVYTGDTPPPKLAGETKMNKEPICIQPVSPAEKLDPRSRINLGKVHPINHNVKVKDVGFVDPRSLPKLLGYRKVIRDRK